MASYSMVSTCLKTDEYQETDALTSEIDCSSENANARMNICNTLIGLWLFRIKCVLDSSGTPPNEFANAVTALPL